MTDLLGEPTRDLEDLVGLPGEIAYSPVIDGDDPRVQPYDFYHQETIERIRLRPLEPVLENAAHRIANALAGQLRQPVVIELVDSEQVSWEEFVNSLPDPTFVTAAMTSPVDGRLLMHLPVPLALQIIDCYLGGDGFTQPERDQLTDLERVFIGPLLEECWNTFATGLSSLVELRLGMIQHAASASNLPVGRAGDMCWIIGMNVQISDNRPHRMQLCLAVSWLLPNVEQIEAEQASGVIEDRPYHEEAEQRLRSVPVELRLRYPAIALTTQEILGLRPGDVVMVREGTPEETAVLDLVVGDDLVGTGILFERGNKLACTVVSKTEEMP